MATIDKKISDKACGRGGWKCWCCKPGRRTRDKFRRRVKRGKVKEFVRKEIRGHHE